ncbi:MAG: phage baseplate assembly protein V [Lentisphaerae bacterium]|uniref:phage baseplate assembly protein V n=1 Tax=Oceanicoccus sp. TaxID=2691044 RepID=UPI002601E5E9|nr:phage baseplate assembly protein V [Oceanicoccus sp.]MCP3908252.1 phage baseplate assembly protein V [Oceanicoccus sp.]MCP4102951.1 phage baseplate assembly protein V [Lentisphaerota bacterium]
MNHYEITELQRNMANLVRIGTIAEADYVNAKVRVQIGELLTGWLDFISFRAALVKVWCPPEIGEQVLVVSPGGDLAQGVVMPALYQQTFPPTAATSTITKLTFADGAKLEYDSAAHHLQAILPGGGTTTLIADGGITITGDITVTGKIVSTGDQIAGGISQINHVHGGVKAGGSTTAKPQ